MRAYFLGVIFQELLESKKWFFLSPDISPNFIEREDESERRSSATYWENFSIILFSALSSKNNEKKSLQIRETKGSNSFINGNRFSYSTDVKILSLGV